MRRFVIFLAPVAALVINSLALAGAPGFYHFSCTRATSNVGYFQVNMAFDVSLSNQVGPTSDVSASFTSMNLVAAMPDGHPMPAPRIEMGQTFDSTGTYNVADGDASLVLNQFSYTPAQNDPRNVDPTELLKSVQVLWSDWNNSPITVTTTAGRTYTGVCQIRQPK